MAAMSSSSARWPGQAKADLRAWARAQRDATALEARASAAAAIAATVDGLWAGLPAGAIVGLYAAMGTELSTAELDARARARGLAVAYPRVVKGERLLRFHLATPAELAPGTFGVAEPPISAPTVTGLAMVVVPGLAFTADGDRLGWGAGHYDATLPVVGGRSLGVALAVQLVDELPVAPHDHRVDLVITERGVASSRGHR